MQKRQRTKRAFVGRYDIGEIREALRQRQRVDRWFPTLPLSALFVGVGYWAAAELIQIAQLQIFKALNLVGLAADLAGFVILSNYVMGAERAKRFVLDEVAPQITNMFGGIPVGMLAACSSLGPGGPSHAAVFQFSVYLQLALAWPPLFYLRFVFSKQALPQEQVDHRVNMIGAFFVAFGFAAQLIAAKLDLYSN